MRCALSQLSFEYVDELAHVEEQVILTQHKFPLPGQNSFTAVPLEAKATLCIILYFAMIMKFSKSFQSAKIL
jgi:hypothetical protein